MELLDGLTDDQVALVGCAAALVICGGLMSLSAFVRPRRTQPLDVDADVPSTRPISAARGRDRSADPRRKAA